MATGASSSADYRSVIDDLTVENKNLKQKLRQYERHQKPGLRSDKVVEVRTFNLPTGKKRELEAILRSFTMTLEDSHGEGSSRNGMAKVGAPLHQKKTSSHTSTRFGDSAYASMSASEPHSNAPSRQSNNYRKISTAAPAPSFTHQQHQTIQSYLQEIPAGLLPKSGPVAMTERSKRKIVVRRLEQIFAGKAPALGGHQHPQQQQEVAQSAAQADRKEIEDHGLRALEEGCREAQIMQELEENARVKETLNDERMSADAKVTAPQDLSNDPFEQRPTRPLDLDPFRAQVPADNIKYFRHLGFSPLDTESAEPQADGHGWIYLNLLINMAQLHTLNVTADFVRKSIADFSGKLELSPDGSEVRWKGGIDVTRTSSDGSPEGEHGRHDGSSHPKPKLRKKSKLATATNSNNGSVEQVPKSNRTPLDNKLAYTPLFFHKPGSDRDDMSDGDLSSGTSSRAAPPSNSPGFTSSGMRTGSSGRRLRDDGPIVFYNKANFCTDLSGEPRDRNLMISDSLNYKRLSTVPVGDADGSSWSSERPLEGRGALSQSDVIAADAMQVDTYSLSEVEIDIDQARYRSTEALSSEASPMPIDLEVSGVGGVVPADNFSIRIKAKRKFEQCGPASMNAIQRQRRKMFSQSIRDILAQRGSENCTDPPISPTPVFCEQIISERRRELPPSSLPPPSFFPFGSPDTDGEGELSESEADEDDLSNNADALAAVHHPLPSAAPQLMDWPTYASDEESPSAAEDDGDASMEDGSDGSLDFLATARELDPIAIHAREREYDSQLADRCADRIPAGSSAATAGGASGFNSPNALEGRLNGKPSRKTPLKRARTSESMAVEPRRSIKSPRLQK